MIQDTAPQIDPVASALRVVDGRRLSNAAPCASVLDPPPQAAHSREGERLFVLLDLNEPVSSHLYRELREVVARSYWSAAGSTTAALRRAAAAANRHLFQANLRSADPSERYSGGLVCAVMCDGDLFILQAGPIRACFLRDRRLECFSPDETLAPLGIGQLADVRLNHTFVIPGDKLLLASSALVEAAGKGGLLRVLPRDGLVDVLDGLEQVGSDSDFTALLVYCAASEKASAVREVMGRLKETVWTRPEPESETKLESEDVTRPVQPHRLMTSASTPREEAPPVRESQGFLSRFRREPSYVVESEDTGLEEAPLEPESPPPEPYELPESLENTGHSLGTAVAERIGEGARTVGRGVAAAGGALVGGLRTLPRHVLPGTEQETRRRKRRIARPVPQENRSMMVTLAISIPVLLAIVVIWAYQSFGEASQFQSIIDQANHEIELAQAAGGISETARSHWETALAHANDAIALRPDDQVAKDLQSKAQSALDQLDGVVRLNSIELWDFGASAAPRRLVVHGQMIFVLDPAGEWVVRLTLNSAGDGVVESKQDLPVLVRREQQVGDGQVGDLIDFIWVDPMGGRRTGGLLILEEDGALISYDPAWEGEGGTPQLTRSHLGVPPGTPVSVETYDGRFYVLDTEANQIRRYIPDGDYYPEKPENYFVASPPRPLNEAIDMAIDGYIYILYQDGAIHKFLGGEPDAFDVRELPGDLSQAVALTVDPNGSSGAIYIADQGRVVTLGPDGAFRAQFCAGEAFNAFEDVAVDESNARLYAIAGGKLYVAPLP